MLSLCNSDNCVCEFVLLCGFLQVLTSWLIQEVMANRNDQNRQLTEALQALAQVLANQGGGAGAAAYQGIDRFQRNDPPSFKGGYDPEGAEEWVREIEKIFDVIACEEDQKVRFAAYVLIEEAGHWWENTRS